MNADHDAVCLFFLLFSSAVDHVGTVGEPVVNAISGDSALIGGNGRPCALCLFLADEQISISSQKLPLFAFSSRFALNTSALTLYFSSNCNILNS